MLVISEYNGTLKCQVNVCHLYYKTYFLFGYVLKDLEWHFLGTFSTWKYPLRYNLTRISLVRLTCCVHVLFFYLLPSHGSEVDFLVDRPLQVTLCVQHITSQVLILWFEQTSATLMRQIEANIIFILIYVAWGDHSGDIVFDAPLFMVLLNTHTSPEMSWLTPLGVFYLQQIFLRYFLCSIYHCLTTMILWRDNPKQCMRSFPLEALYILVSTWELLSCGFITVLLGKYSFITPTLWWVMWDLNITKHLVSVNVGFFSELMCNKVN